MLLRGARFRSSAVRSLARNAYLLSRDYWEELQYLVRNYRLNEPRRRAFDRSPAGLAPVQNRIVADLARDGIAMASFEELFADAALWDRVLAAANAFSANPTVQDRLEMYRRGVASGAMAGKEFLVRCYAERSTFALDNLWLTVGLDARILDVVNTYLGLMSRLHYLDVWYTIPAPVGTPKSSSQNWHRDHEDKKQVKVFLYCSDVDDSAGPFQYVPRSRLSADGFGRLWRRRSQLYPPPDQFATRVPVERAMTCTGPSGTMVFCDTTGFHRGGYATGRARTLANWIYVTGAAFTARRFSLDPSVRPDGLSTAARHAIG